MIKFGVTNRFSGAIQFTAEIECGDDAPTSVKLGLAARWAIKSRADLSRADLSGAKDAEYAIACTRILPEGEIIGWKKCNDGVIAKLLIPRESRRCHAFGRKCRADDVDVLEVIGADVGITNSFGARTEYRAGQRVQCDAFNEDFTNECSGGIHFFITRAEAEAY